MTNVQFVVIVPCLTVWLTHSILMVGEIGTVRDTCLSDVGCGCAWSEACLTACVAVAVPAVRADCDTVMGVGVGKRTACACSDTFGGSVFGIRHRGIAFCR